jgi:hypothetical protein
VQIGFHRQAQALRSDLFEHLAVFQQYASTGEEHRLLAWCRLQIIAEDIEEMKRRVDPRNQDSTPSDADWDSTSLSNILKEWQIGIGSSTIDGMPANAQRGTADPLLVSLGIEVGFCKSKLFELALMTEYDGQQHLDVSSLATRSRFQVNPTDSPLNPTYVRSLLGFVDGCHHILDRLLQTDVETLRALPLLSGLRIPYAFKALSMLELRADQPENNVNRTIDRDTLKWLSYARKVSRLLEECSDNGAFVAPSVALRIRNQTVDQARLRYEGQSTGLATPVDPASLEPRTNQGDALQVPATASTAYDASVFNVADFGYSPDLWDLFALSTDELIPPRTQDLV